MVVLQNRAKINSKTTMFTSTLRAKGCVSVQPCLCILAVCFTSPRLTCLRILLNFSVHATYA